LLRLFSLITNATDGHRARATPFGYGVSTASFMTAENLVELLEEMMDLKIQHYAETRSKLSPEVFKLTPEVARLLQDKRETDRRRLEQIRTELVRFMES